MNDFCQRFVRVRVSRPRQHTSTKTSLECPPHLPRGILLAWDHGITGRSTSSSSPRPFSPVRNHHAFITYSTRPGAVGEKVLRDLFSNQEEWTMFSRAQLSKGCLPLTQG